MTKKPLCLVISSLALVAGGMIYLMARPRNLLLFWIADRTGIGSLISTLRANLQTEWPEWMVYNLPGGLWSLSYILLIHALASQLDIRTRMLLTSVIPIVGVVSELLQGMGLLPGTFDLVDMAFYITPYVAYMIITIKHTERHEYQSNT